VKWTAAILAGLAAGALATIVEIVLWLVFTDALPGILFRDARFAAAIVMGPSALSPTVDMDWRILLVATIVHFDLSVVYALILCAMIWRLHVFSSLVVGALFGALLYVINMYGFTAVFPWFAAARDWITFVAHVTFAMIAAGTYRVLTR
jgi:hypothetical protein